MDEHEPENSAGGSSSGTTTGTRPSTARLFGGFVYLERRSRQASPEVFLAPVDQTVDWLIAVERGEVVPTDDMLLLLEQCFAESGERIFLNPVLLELELDSYGPTAGRIREELGIPIEWDDLPESGEPLGENALPVIAAIRQEDRLLILAPVLLALLVLVVGLNLGIWAARGHALLDLWSGFGALAGGLAFSAFLLTPVDSTLSTLAGLGRSRAARDTLDRCDETRESAGLPAKTWTWFTPKDEPHLLAGARAAVWSNGVVAEFAERLYALMTATLAIVTLGSIGGVLRVGW